MIRLRRVKSCWSTVAVQVQWNACYATGRLFKNRAAAGVADQSRQLGMLLSALLDVIRANSSFKVRVSSHRDTLCNCCANGYQPAELRWQLHLSQTVNVQSLGMLMSKSPACKTRPERNACLRGYDSQGCAGRGTGMLMLLSRYALHLQIRSHAAAALANLGQRSLYGDLWEEALQTSYDAFVGLHNSGDGSDSSINAGMLQTALLCLQLLVVALQHTYSCCLQASPGHSAWQQYTAVLAFLLSRVLSSWP